MKTYKLTQVALLEIWDDNKPLFEVEIDGSTYYATSTLYGEVILGPPIPLKLKYEPTEEKDESVATIFVNGSEYIVSKVVGRLYKHNILRLAGKVDHANEVTYRYRDGRCGTMDHVDGLVVEDGMIFNVQYTGNA